MAAGFGTRMRPLTDHVPKPLVQLSGRPLLDYIVDHLKDFGISDITVNAHYLADEIFSYARARRDVDVRVSYEADILDTGLGLKNAIHHFGDRPFFVINGDSFWVNSADDHKSDLLSNMADHWDADKMDVLIALQPVTSMSLTKPVGDYVIDADGRAVRSLDKSGTHMFTSVRINAPSVCAGMPGEPFSYLRIMDEAQLKGRLYAYEHAGDWHHISTPEDLKRVEEEVFG